MDTRRVVLEVRKIQGLNIINRYLESLIADAREVYETQPANEYNRGYLNALQSVREQIAKGE